MKVFWVSKRLAFGSAVTTLEPRGATPGAGHYARHQPAARQARQEKSASSRACGCRSGMTRSLARIGSTVGRCASTRRPCESPTSKVLCMCHHGMCRSPSLTYFFLRVDGFSPARAKSTVLKARKRARVVPAYQRSGEDFRSLYKFRQIIKGKRHQILIRSDNVKRQQTITYWEFSIDIIGPTIQNEELNAGQSTKSCPEDGCGTSNKRPCWQRRPSYHRD